MCTFTAQDIVGNGTWSWKNALLYLTAQWQIGHYRLALPDEQTSSASSSLCAVFIHCPVFGFSAQSCDLVAVSSVVELTRWGYWSKCLTVRVVSDVVLLIKS